MSRKKCPIPKGVFVQGRLGLLYTDWWKWCASVIKKMARESLVLGEWTLLELVCFFTLEALGVLPWSTFQNEHGLFMANLVIWTYLWKPYTISNFLLLHFPFQLYISTTFQLFMDISSICFFSPPSFWRWRISVQDVILGSFSSQPSKSSSQHWSQLWRSWPPPENQPDIGQFPHFSIGHTSTQNLHSMVYLFQPVMISFRSGVYNW